MKKIKYNISFRFIIHIFSFLFIFASYDSFQATDFTIFMREHFVLGIGAARFFSILEILLFFILFFLILKFNLNKHFNSSLEKFIFFFALICQIFDIINPNNTHQYRIFGMNLIHDFHAYTYLIFMYVIFKLNSDKFIVFFNYLIHIFFLYAVVRAIILTIPWALGKGAYGYGFNATLIEGDTLIIYAFLVLISLSYFFITHKKKYMLFSFLYFFIILFSYRRSALALLFLAILLFSIIYFNSFFSSVKKIVAISISLFLFLFLSNQNINLINIPYFNDPLIERYISAIPGMSDPNNIKYSDSGHWKQSLVTASVALEKGKFWGVGYGNIGHERFEGASKGIWIHNAYAAAWLYHGIYLLLFYIFLLLFYITSYIKILIKKETNIKTIAKAIFISTLIAFMLVIYTNPIQIINHIRMEIMWLLILAFIIKVNNKNIQVLKTN